MLHCICQSVQLHHLKEFEIDTQFPSAVQLNAVNHSFLNASQAQEGLQVLKNLSILYPNKTFQLM